MIQNTFKYIINVMSAPLRELALRVNSPTKNGNKLRNQFNIFFLFSCSPAPSTGCIELSNPFLRKVE